MKAKRSAKHSIARKNTHLEIKLHLSTSSHLLFLISSHLALCAPSMAKTKMTCLLPLLPLLLPLLFASFTYHSFHSFAALMFPIRLNATTSQIFSRCLPNVLLSSHICTLLSLTLFPTTHHRHDRPIKCPSSHNQPNKNLQRSEVSIVHHSTVTLDVLLLFISSPFYLHILRSHSTLLLIQVRPFGPNIEGTALRPNDFPPFILTRGTPATTRGSRINSGSNRAGIRHITERYSPLKAPDGDGTAALRHKWSLRSSRKDVAALEKNEEAENPRFRFARIISSKRRIFGSLAGVDSRSLMNSLNPIGN